MTILRDEGYDFDANIDLLFLGSSHIYRGINPYVVEEQLAVNSFNIGSSSQNPIDSFYVLQDALKFHSPKIVIYEVYWMIMEGDDFDFNSATYNYDHMHFSRNKIQYMFSAFKYDQWLKANFLSVRYHDNWSNTDAIKFNLRKKYLNKLLGVSQRAAVSSKDEKYIGQGFVASKRIVSKEELTNNNISLTMLTWR